MAINLFGTIDLDDVRWIIDALKENVSPAEFRESSVEELLDVVLDEYSYLDEE